MTEESPNKRVMNYNHLNLYVCFAWKNGHLAWGYLNSEPLYFQWQTYLMRVLLLSLWMTLTNYVTVQMKAIEHCNIHE